jgi:hypothetical protein
MQNGLEDGEIVILTGSNGFTVIVTILPEAGLPEVQISEEVRIQVTTSLFKGG